MVAHAATELFANSESHGAEWYNSQSSYMLSVFIRVTAGVNFTGLYPVYQIPRYRMWNFTCRLLYLPPYPTNAPFGIWHLLRTAQSGLEAALPIAFDGLVSIPFSSTGREIQIGYNLQKWFFGGRSSFAPCFERQVSSSTNVCLPKVNLELITLFR